jgi:hypothetical protein
MSKAKSAKRIAQSRCCPLLRGLNCGSGGTDSREASEVGVPSGVKDMQKVRLALK